MFPATGSTSTAAIVSRSASKTAPTASASL